MNFRDFENRVRGRFHHHAIFHLEDGSTKEGYMQPNDDQNVYLTTLDGQSGGSVKISEIKSIEWPDDG
jgi:hypothetical protein